MQLETVCPKTHKLGVLVMLNPSVAAFGSIRVIVLLSATLYPPVRLTVKTADSPRNIEAEAGVVVIRGGV
jgi:hypothetical protein